MDIVINLSPEIEAILAKKALSQKQKISQVASELLTTILEWERQEKEEAIKGIKKGLEDFEEGRFRSFEEFAKEERNKHNLPQN
jgi:predicted transcriptional regulator